MIPRLNLESDVFECSLLVPIVPGFKRCSLGAFVNLERPSSYPNVLSILNCFSERVCLAQTFG